MTKKPRTLALLATGILLLSMAAYFYFSASKKQSYQLTISAGSSKGMRAAIAETLGQFTELSNVDLEVVATAGSREALGKVNAGDLDFALVQGGLVNKGFSNVRQVAVLHVEPLHLLVRPKDETPDHLTLRDMAQWMAGRNQIVVNVSTPGSGTNALASELLHFFDVQSPIQLSTLPYTELVNPARSPKDLPDAIFTVSSLPSPIATYLIHERDYRPVELPVAKAFRIDWKPDSPQDNKQPIRKRHLTDSIIPAFTYRVDPPVPSVDIRTLGTRLQLISNKNVPPDAVEKVVDSIYGTSYANISDPALTIELLQTSAEYELHQGASSYLEKKTPVITERVVELTEQLLAILGTVCGGLLFVWQAVSYTRQRHRDRQFLAYIGRVGEIESRAMRYEKDGDMSVDDLVVLQLELNDIKTEMVKQFQNGDIDGADTLSTFLLQVNDVNENLNRTILHERKPKELTQGKDPLKSDATPNVEDDSK